jgi:hypothetical protein
MKKITVLMIGVTRPNSDRIIDNIENNIKYFKLNYFNKFSFNFIVFTYKNLLSDKVHEYCIKNDIKFVDIEQIKDFKISNFYSQKINSIPRLNINTHRLVLSMKNALNYVNSNSEIVIRLRIDTELIKFELVDEIEKNTYYSSPNSGGITDNIGFSDFNTFLSVWNIDNLFIESVLSKNNEIILKKWCEKINIKIKYFNYKYILHQSNDEFFDGVLQWSKRTRNFEYEI